MLRVISNLGKNIRVNLTSKNVLRIHFSSEQKVAIETDESDKTTFDQKAEIFERFSNSHFGFENLEQYVENQKNLAANNFDQSVIEDQIIKGLKELYGKNYEKIFNKRFTLEIDGHKDGVALGEFHLFPKNVLEHGQFENLTQNGDLISELQQSTYVSINPKETHKYVVGQDSHFSLFLNEFIPDEYVSELNDNQVCLFGFPKTCDAEDIHNLLQNELKANTTADVIIGEDVLSLPAYVILTFASPSEAAAYKNKVNALNLVMSQKPIYATTFEDSRSEHSTNRTLLISGFRNEESFNDLLNFLGTFGSVMHFEMVEEPVHSKLPTTEQVLKHLKTIVKEGDDSIIYEITDISDGAPEVTEYPPYNPNIEVMRDGKKLSELNDEIEIEAERQKLLAKRQLLPRIVLNTWDSDVQLPEEYKLKNSTPEQQKILQSIEKSLRTEYQNKQYLFLTYACTKQTQLAHYFLNSTGVYEATLKKSTEHYHCDTAHQTSVFKQIKQIKGDVKLQLNDQRIATVEEEQLLAKTHKEMKEQLLEQANSFQFSQELSTLLEKEVIGKSKHSVEHQLHLKSDKLGREFSAKVTRDDLNQISTQFQDIQKKNMESIDALKKEEDELLNLYRAKIIYGDINKITHPNIKADSSTQDKITENLQEQALKEYKARQKEYLQEQNIREKWMEETQELLEKKITSGRVGRKKSPRTSSTEKGGDDVPDIKEPKEEEPDQYYAPHNDYIQKKKVNKYQKYVGEMQRLYDGEYTEAMKERIFKNTGYACKDADGKNFVQESDGYVFDKQILSDEQFQTLKYYLSVADVIPMKRLTDLAEQLEQSPDETRYMVNQTKLPTRVFDRNNIPELDETAVPLNNEEFVGELNKYVAELGQHYSVQKDARGDEKIIMFQNTPHQVPLYTLNVDEIQLLRDCLTTYGFDAEATEREIQYFIKNGDYSEEVQKIVGSEQTIDEENEIEALIHATGLSKAELESILKLDLEKDGAKVAKSLQDQREEMAFEIKMGTAQPKDLIKTNSKLKNKDKQGRYKGSSFKLF